MGQSLPLFVDQPPKYEARGEVMFVRWPSGLEIAMPVSVCKKAVARCNRALDEWHERRGSCVLQFPAPPH